jgi:hypothetical protein
MGRGQCPHTGGQAGNSGGCSGGCSGSVRLCSRELGLERGELGPVAYKNPTKTNKKQSVNAYLSHINQPTKIHVYKRQKTFHYIG